MNCKPGDLARIVSNGGTDLGVENRDRIVEVIRPAVEGDSFVSVEGAVASVNGWTSPAWVVRCKTPLAWYGRSRADGAIVLMGHFHERAIGDAWLRPIGGVPLDEEIHDEMTV